MIIVTFETMLFAWLYVWGFVMILAVVPSRSTTYRIVRALLWPVAIPLLMFGGFIAGIISTAANERRP
jgi:hypothetical protein